MHAEQSTHLLGDIKYVVARLTTRCIALTRNTHAGHASVQREHAIHVGVLQSLGDSWWHPRDVWCVMVVAATFVVTDERSVVTCSLRSTSAAHEVDVCCAFINLRGQKSIIMTFGHTTDFCFNLLLF